MNRRFCSVVALLVAPCLASAGLDEAAPSPSGDQGVASVDAGPVIAGGLWDVTIESTEYGPQYDGGPLVEKRKSWRELRCRATGSLVGGGVKWLVSADGAAFARVGFSAGSSNSVTTIASGDFTNSYDELDTSYSYPVGEVRFGYREVLSHVRRRFTRRGECPVGMNPGDWKEWSAP